MSIGVLGGMGTRATWKFCQHLTDMIAAEKEWDHPNVTVHIRAKIPSRTRALLYGETDPTIYIADAMRRIKADVIAAPCNSVHYWYDAVKRSVDVNWLNMIELVSARVNLAPSTLVVGGYVTMTQALYSSEVTYPIVQYDRIAETLEDLRTGRGLKDYHLFEDLYDLYRPKMILLACTEFLLLPWKLSFPSRPTIVDSGRIYAQEVVRIWKEQFFS